MSPSAEKIAPRQRALRVRVLQDSTNKPPTTTPRHRRDDDDNSRNGRPRKQRQRHKHMIRHRQEYPLDGTCCSCSRHACCSSDPRTDCECRRARRKCTRKCFTPLCRNQPLEPSASDDGPPPAAHAADNHPTPPPQGDPPPPRRARVSELVLRGTRPTLGCFDEGAGWH